MFKLSKRFRNSLLGVLLVAIGYISGQPAQIVQGFDAIAESVIGQFPDDKMVGEQ